MTKSRGIRVRRGTRQRWVEEQSGKHYCECGCGKPIPLQPGHYPNAPKFLHGHNTRVAPPNPRKELPPQTSCACGCGALAAPGRQYISGHNGKGRPRSEETRRRIAAGLSGERNQQYGKRGPEVHNWKGGRTMSPEGYIEILMPDHPAKNGRYVREHRLVMEAWLRENDPTSEFLTPTGYLSPGADVHHVNERTWDNRIENLRPMWKDDHARLHRSGRRLRAQAAVLEAIDASSRGNAHTSEIVAATGLSRGTVRNALEKLRDDGVLWDQPQTSIDGRTRIYWGRVS